MDKNFITDSTSIAKCIEPVDSFADHAFHSEYDPWEGVHFHGRDDIVQELSNFYKAVRIASDVDSSSITTVLQKPGKLTMQRRTPVKSTQD